MKTKLNPLESGLYNSPTPEEVGREVAIIKNRRLSVSVGIAAFLFLFVGSFGAGCDRGPDSKMLGTYVLQENPQATLNVTSDKMLASLGPMTITVDYKVLSAAAADVTVEVRAANTPKGNMVVTVRDGSLVIKGDAINVLVGTWTRK